MTASVYYLAHYRTNLDGLTDNVSLSQLPRKDNVTETIDFGTRKIKTVRLAQLMVSHNEQAIKYETEWNLDGQLRSEKMSQRCLAELQRRGLNDKQICNLLVVYGNLKKDAK